MQTGATRRGRVLRVIVTFGGRCDSCDVVRGCEAVCDGDRGAERVVRLTGAVALAVAVVMRRCCCNRGCAQLPDTEGSSKFTCFLVSYVKRES